MDDVRKKIQLFQVEIRRSDRQRIMSVIRNNLQFDKLFTQFKTSKPHQVSKAFLEGLKTISNDMIEKVISFFQTSTISVCQKMYEWPQQWTFDYMSVNNLRMMSFLGKYKWTKFMKSIFQKTIEAHKRYRNVSHRMQLDVRDSKCYIRPQKASQKDLQQFNILSSLEERNNEERFLAVLEFWATTIHFQSKFLPEEYIVMIKTFTLWYDHTKIERYQETYNFIGKILNFIVDSKILITEKTPMVDLKQDCQLFIDKLRRIMPYTLATFTFKEIGEILILLIELNQQIPGGLSEILYRQDTIKLYLTKIFSLDSTDTNISSIKVGLFLICHLQQIGNFLQSISFENNSQILDKMLSQYLFHSQLQNLALIVLMKLADKDSRCKLRVRYEEIDYEKLFMFSDIKSQRIIYDFCLIVLQNYPQNSIICQKLFEQCDFIRSLKIFDEIIEKQEQNQFYRFQKFVKIMSSRMNYYVKFWRRHVIIARDYTQQLDFQGSEQFLKQSFAQIELSRNQQCL